MSKPSQSPRHPIRVVARRSGLSVDVIRAWESRYAVVQPARTDSGRRLYSDADVARLTLLRRATEAGRGIGQVAGFGTTELARLVGEDAGAAQPAASADPVSEALRALNTYDAERVEAALRSAAVRLPVHELIESVLAPFLREVGERWHRAEVTVAQEHLATGIVRSVLTSLPRQVGLPPEAPLVVVATLAGERHEVGAMMAAATAWASGCRVVYLGADVPAREIGEVAAATGAAMVALSLTYAPPDAGVPAALKVLRKAAPGVTVVAGGRVADAYLRPLAVIDGAVLGSTNELKFTLESLKLSAA